MSSSASAVSVSPSSDEHSLFSVSSLTNGCDVQLVGQHQQSQAPNNNNINNNVLLSSNSSSSVNGLGSGGGGGGGGGGNGSNSGSPPQSAQSQSFTDVGHLGRIFHECRSRLLVKQKNLEELTGRLQAQYGKAQGDVGRSYQTLQAAVEKGRNDLMKELDDVYNARIVSLTIFTSKIEENLHKIEQILLYMEQQQQNAAAAASDGSASPNINADMYSCKSFIDNKLQAILNIDLDSSVHSHELEFVLNYHLVQALVQSNFGSIRSSPNGSNNGGGGGGQQGPAGGNNNGSGKQAIGRTGSSGFGSGGSSLSSNGFADHSESLSSRFNQMSMSNGAGNGNGLHHQHQQPSSNHHGSHHNQSSNNNHNHHNHHSNNNNNRSLNSSVSESLNLFGSGYDKWSQGGNGMVNGHGLGGGGGGGGGNHHHHHHQHQHSRGNSNSSPDSALFTHWSNAVGPDGLDGLAADPMLDLNSGAHLNSHGHIGSGLGNAPSATSLSDALSNVSMGGGGGGGGTPTSNSSGTVMPIKSQVQRQKMIYHCKFGEFGIMEGQFTEPSGVAVNAQNDIIVADTNNHRIQIFDKDGRFKFQFGECGKRDGQLLYPNRVAVVKQSGDIIVTERSPTHQIQVYNQYGQFVRKFGADILQHPRGVTVDHKGNIIIVECKVMRVIIFDLAGNVFHKFGCSKHLEFPNGVVVNDKQEIFISDNRAHCVKVFSYGGVFLRNIGGEGLTNYPIGVCINDNGEILVADNHNNFNITIFTQEGALVNALESKVKHSQCFDVALMDDNSVVLASKDYRIYIYRYLQLQSLATAVATSGIC